MTTGRTWYGAAGLLLISAVTLSAAELDSGEWNFTGPNARRIDVVRMCEDYRVEAVMNESFDPHAAPHRPLPRTE